MLHSKAKTQTKTAIKTKTATKTKTAKPASSFARGAQNYNNKVIEFAQTNTKVVLDLVRKLSGVKSLLDFIELSTRHSRKQFEILIKQTKELAALVQKVALASRIAF